MVWANRASVSELCSISVIRIEVGGGGHKSLIHKSITTIAIAALCDGLHGPALLHRRWNRGGFLCITHWKLYKSYIQEFLRGIIKVGTCPESGQLGEYDFFLSNAPLVRDGLRGLPSWAWQKCNRLLRFGRPWGAVTLSRWCEWWYRRM